MIAMIDLWRYNVGAVIAANMEEVIVNWQEKM